MFSTASRVLAVPVAAALLGLAPPPAVAAPPVAGPYQRGPAPTEEVLVAARGPFAVTQTRMAAGQGTGAGTVHHPTDASQGTFGAVAVMPGFMGTEKSIRLYGPLLASHGFVVLTLSSVRRADFPDQRADQLLAALDRLVAGPAKGLIDAERLAVVGHSMGGGATLRAAARRPGLKAAVPLAPWHVRRDWRSVRVPTLIFGSENDRVAPVDKHAEPFYASLTRAPEKAYVELRDGGHLSFNTANPVIAKYTVSWLKRYVDDDVRYDPFLCPGPAFPSPTIREYRGTCPS
ncbi:dienelactone hydrolase family protein [Actinocorallia sp. API 0066]|uniref:dienelactone hydrolase family protein n=1 Tax=Actinocorallia sp. API 0066 TaxID=2896846 RepID=UPI001E3ACD94|nr:dienelactone hydrolase family protein [Actinocorallia sp. API 0066]MCD0450822.1 dienelactone hydrolase family protein [Actinocorallia sp. API 0066]